MARIVQSSWFTAVVGGVLYLGVTFLLLSPSHFKGARAANAQEEQVKTPENDPSWKFKNPEMEQWLAELKREREALQLREQQLQELALRLEAERSELTAITQTVYQLQAEFDRNVIRFNEQEITNLKRQARVFANMSQDAVAALLAGMQEDEAVKILHVMKNDDVSALLDLLGGMGKAEAKKAASITERLRRALPPEPKAKSRSS
ncbi:MAG TPA: hypothetical protein VEH04_11595 [Verrucomicrobiae bacterium]|nr:hypothetical protein [Verrucomicrobiae bacterium]